MLILLIAVLIIIYFNYVKKEPNEVTTKNDFSGDVELTSTPTTSPLAVPNITDLVETNGSGNVIIQDTPVPTNTIEAKKTTKLPKITSTPVPEITEEPIVTSVPQIEKDENIIVEPIISSDNETSNQDKQQVLSEIDDALQGLLEAVGKVPTVDEEKLNKTLENSEV
jgi:hypothetical protein